MIPFGYITITDGTDTLAVPDEFYTSRPVYLNGVKVGFIYALARHGVYFQPLHNPQAKLSGQRETWPAQIAALV
jgi:hypothetical protein